jgi:hypothetical protein
MNTSTLPVGVPTPGDSVATVTLKVMVSPVCAGFSEETTVVLVLAWLTTWTTLPSSPLKLPSPA